MTDHSAQTAAAADPARISPLAEIVAANIEWSQRERRLSPAVVDALHDAGLFRLLIPRECDGDGLHEYQIMPLIEAVARIDGSAGWNFAIGNGTLGMARGLSEDAASEIFATPKSLACGSLSPALTIRDTPEGAATITGRGVFLSGCSQSNWMMGNGRYLKDDAPVLGSNGSPALRMAFFPANKATILDTWHTTGLRGTGSHDALYPDIAVRPGFTLDPMGGAATRFDPLGPIPITVRLACNLTAVGLGVAQRAIDELAALAQTKANFGGAGLIRDRADVLLSTGRAVGLLSAARVSAAFTAAEFSTQVLAGYKPGISDFLRVRRALVTASSLALESIDLIHRAAGTSTLDDDSVIGRCWRDVHAVVSHATQQPKHFENAGRDAFGLPPQGMI